MTNSHERELLGRRMPDIALRATTGDTLSLRELTVNPTVVFFYPKTGDPGKPDSAAWTSIPGARGCTAETCSFRDLRRDFEELGWNIVGCSSQTSEYQTEASTRLHLPYPLLSDTELALADILGLPTFEFDGFRLFRRITLLLHDCQIVGVVDPGDDPTGHVEEVLKTVRAIAVPA